MRAPPEKSAEACSAFRRSSSSSARRLPVRFACHTKERSQRTRRKGKKKRRGNHVLLVVRRRRVASCARCDVENAALPPGNHRGSLKGKKRGRLPIRECRGVFSGAAAARRSGKEERLDHASPSPLGFLASARLGGFPQAPRPLLAGRARDSGSFTAMPRVGCRRPTSAGRGVVGYYIREPNYS